MKLARAGFSSIVFLAVTGLISGPTPARGELQWQSTKMEPVRLRLVALAWNHPRTSFFSNEEVFIAEKQLSKDESRLVKLVYDFLPYQPRLSEYGLDYDTVHELRAVRDPECDETLAQLLNRPIGDWRQPSQLKYSTDAPPLNPERHKSRLPCYVTSADDYTKPLHEPTVEPE